MGTEGLSRRRAIAGAAAVGLAAPALAACGSGADDEPVVETPKADPGEVLGRTSDVAVGACAVFSEQKVVVTQPSEGDFRCFSAVCTHQGCLVSSSSDGEIPCTCHGSRFSLEDGSVLAGPATAPLPEVPVRVEGDQILKA